MSLFGKIFEKKSSRDPQSSFDYSKVDLITDPGLGAVRKICFSPENQLYLITSSGLFRCDSGSSAPEKVIADGTIRDISWYNRSTALITAGNFLLRNGQTTRQLDQVPGYTPITGIWSPDGSSILTGWSEMGSDWYGPGKIRITDLQGNVQWEQTTANSWPISFTWNKYMMAVGDSCGMVRVYDHRRELIQEFELNGLSPVAKELYAEDDKLYIAGVDDNNGMQLLRWTRNGQEILESNMISGHDAVALGTGDHLAFTAGKSAGRRHGRIYIRSAGKESSVKADGDTGAVAFSADNSLLAVIDRSGLRIIEVSKARVKSALTLNDNGTCKGMAISADSSLIATWNNSGDVFFYSPHNGTVIAKVKAGNDCIFRGFFLPDNDLAIVTEGHLQRVNPDESRIIDLGMEVDQVLGLLCDQRTLAISCMRVNGQYDPVLILYDIITGRITKRLQGGQGMPGKVVLSSDKKYLMMVTGGGIIEIFDFHGGNIIRSIYADKGQCYATSMSPDGQDLAWVSPRENMNDRILMLGTVSGKEDEIKGFNSRLGILSFSPDGQWLICGVYGEESPSFLIDIQTKRKVFSFKNISNISWSQDSNLFAVADGLMSGHDWRIYDCSGTEIIRQSAGGPVESICFAPDGSYLCTVTMQGEVRIFYPRKPE